MRATASVTAEGAAAGLGDEPLGASPVGQVHGGSGADLADDFGGRQTAEPGCGPESQSFADAIEQARGIKIPGAGGVDDR